MQPCTYSHVQIYFQSKVKRTAGIASWAIATWAFICIFSLLTDMFQKQIDQTKLICAYVQLKPSSPGKFIISFCLLGFLNYFWYSRLNIFLFNHDLSLSYVVYFLYTNIFSIITPKKCSNNTDYFFHKYLLQLKLNWIKLSLKFHFATNDLL